MTKREIAESVFTILAILSLWPVLFEWDHPIYQVILGVVLVILCALVIGKFRRFRQEADKKRLDVKNRPPGPPGPPGTF